MDEWWLLLSVRLVLVKENDLIEKVNSVGRFLAECAAHHREWFTSITPIEDHPIDAQREHLTESFFRGVSARYDHILADLDVRRPDLFPPPGKTATGTAAQLSGREESLR